MTDPSFLAELECLIRSRIDESPDDSYTARLAAQGVLAAAQKVGEEAVELALAAAAQTERAVIDEAADLLYHLLVLLALREIPLAGVVAALEQRHRDRAVK